MKKLSKFFKKNTLYFRPLTLPFPTDRSDNAKYIKREILKMDISCPHCQTTLEVGLECLGLNVECPICHTDFIIQKSVVKVSSKPKGESIVQSGTQSWAPYIPAIIVGILSLWIGIGFLIIIIELWKKYSVYYQVTTKNIKVLYGVLIVDESSVRIKDIRGIALIRDFWDSITGCGTIVIGTSATAGAEIIIPHIKNVEKLREKINSLREE